ncbi:MAG: hypothetical protein ABS79_03730 [Planctomycetes bacterium SCN 63-9]|nr:MAG: hypothetical protein ABS79_03730 [Planctomycetes bacterium SCN 63-9]
MVISIRLCRIASWATLGATPPALNNVPNVVLNACTSTVRPRSSALGIPAIRRSRLRILLSLSGTQKSGAAGSSFAGIGSPVSRAASRADSSLRASQSATSAARSSLNTMPFPSRFFSSAASRSMYGILPSRATWATVSEASSFFRSPVRMSVL